jgi:hypothetical protein
VRPQLTCPRDERELAGKKSEVPRSKKANLGMHADSSPETAKGYDSALRKSDEPSPQARWWANRAHRGDGDRPGFSVRSFREARFSVFGDCRGRGFWWAQFLTFDSISPKCPSKASGNFSSAYSASTGRMFTTDERAKQGAAATRGHRDSYVHAAARFKGKGQCNSTRRKHPTQVAARREGRPFLCSRILQPFFAVIEANAATLT